MSTAPTPVSPEHMRNVAGLATAYPRSSPWQTLAGEGFESIVCLTDDKTRYDPRPLKILRRPGSRSFTEERIPRRGHRSDWDRHRLHASRARSFGA
jgi:hypothetical protein